jgi:hypothetical protein
VNVTTLDIMATKKMNVLVYSGMRSSTEDVVDVLMMGKAMVVLLNPFATACILFVDSCHLPMQSYP